MSSGAAVAIAFSLEATKLTLHEPVFLDCIIRNGSSAAIDVDLGRGRTGNFSITITEPDGSLVHSPRSVPEGAARIGLITLAPGQQHRQRLLISEWHNFKETGTYGISAALTGVCRNAVIPERMTLTMLPRNPGRLRVVCGALLDTAMSSTVKADAVEASLALSFVRDPIAVPYLKRALGCGGAVSLRAVQGLGRIRSKAAISVLVAVARSGDRELAPLAWFLLQEIKPVVRGPSLKKRTS